MGMSDCIKCWDTPCTCGWKYRHMDKDYRVLQASIILGVPKSVIKNKLGELIPVDHPMKRDK